MKSIDALTRKFPLEVQDSKRGGGGILTYVGWSHYARRLIEAYGHDWSFEVMEHQTVPALSGRDAATQALAFCRLTVPILDRPGQYARYESWGACEPQKGEAIRDMGDALKSAQSDALKGCARLLGLGLHLYTEAEYVPDLLTSRQMDAIERLAKKADISLERVEEKCQSLCGCALVAISRSEAERLIKRLAKQVDEASGSLITDRQAKVIRELTGRLDQSRNDIQVMINDLLGRWVDDSHPLTEPEADQVIDDLERRLKAA